MTKKTALITGAGGGLGHATVERLVANGWKVFAADISKDLLRASMHDPDVVPVVIDVTDQESIQGAYDAVASQTDRLDGPGRGRELRRHHGRRLIDGHP
jgi:NAD(P)-dependent dehydrogenase (short-subunit alcohol dehydrogenase family)